MSDEVEDGSAGSGAVGTGNDERVAMLERINDGVDTERADQLANVNDDDTTEPFQATKTEQPPEDTTQDPPAGDPVANPTTVKLKVNGKELELPLEEVIARAQKVESADQYLADAAARKRELEEQARAAQQPQQREEPRTEEVDYSAMARALQVGSEEEAVASLKKLVQQATARPSKPDDVSRVIDERLSFRDAYNGFRTEFKDIVDDPKLYAMALQMDNEQTTKGDTRPYAERYTEIGNELRGWVNGFKTPVEQPAQPTQSRQERKEAMPATPNAASGKAAPAAREQEEDDSPSAVVARMAAARGGPQWMRDLPKSA